MQTSEVTGMIERQTIMYAKNRRTGRTTRLINDYIEQLLNGEEVNLVDHDHEQIDSFGEIIKTPAFHSQNKELQKRISARLASEHGYEIVRKFPESKELSVKNLYVLK